MHSLTPYVCVRRVTACRLDTREDQDAHAGSVANSNDDLGSNCVHEWHAEDAEQEDIAAKDHPAEDLQGMERPLESVDSHVRPLHDFAKVRQILSIQSTFP